MPAQNKVARRNSLVFQLGGILFALPAEEISEVILFPALVQSPVRTDFLDGFLNLRGTAVPVVSMHYLLGLKVPLPEMYTPIIVTAPAGEALGFRVDRVDEVIALDDAAYQPYSGSASINGCVEAQCSLNGDPVLLLSARKLILTKERQFLAAWKAETQRRLENLGEAPSQ